MSPKPDSNASPPPLFRLARSLWGVAVANQRWLVLSAVLATMWFTGRALWNHVRQHVAAQPEYQLDPLEIGVTPPPPWVHADVRDQVVRSAGLGSGLSILDDGLVERVYQAFSLHPWVAKVEQVSKRLPAHVEVSLVYRRPVAMVKVQDGLYPVDNDGVLLPTDDFSSADAKTYPRLEGVESSPLGSVGTHWGDPIVAGGAKIGEVLAPLWNDLDLRAIRWNKNLASSSVSSQAVGPAQFEILTAGGATFVWGSAPGSEVSGEPSGDQKVTRLKSLLVGHAGDGADPDLRHAQTPLRSASRTGL